VNFARDSFFVSLNPYIPLDHNLSLFAPLDDPEVRGLLRAACGVILPGYVSPWRYAAVTRLARRWFPRLEGARSLTGKARQILAFRRLGVRHPDTWIFRNREHAWSALRTWGSPWGYPAVLKGDSGGGGSAVFPVRDPAELRARLDRLPAHEPVLLQRLIDHGGRDLRVVVYGPMAVSYFRVGGGGFYNNISKGAAIDHEVAPEEQQKGVRACLDLSRRLGIDLAAFDLMFPDDGPPVFVEINFNFGRKGLGGAPGHREYLRRAVELWCREARSGEQGLRIKD